MRQRVTGIHARGERGKPGYAVDDSVSIDDHGRGGNHPIPLRQFEMALHVAFDDHDVGPRGGKLPDRVPRLGTGDAVLAVKHLEKVKHDEQHSCAELILL